MLLNILIIGGILLGPFILIAFPLGLTFLVGPFIYTFLICAWTVISSVISYLLTTIWNLLTGGFRAIYLSYRYARINKKIGCAYMKLGYIRDAAKYYTESFIYFPGYFYQWIKVFNVPKVIATFSAFIVLLLITFSIPISLLDLSMMELNLISLSEEEGKVNVSAINAAMEYCPKVPVFYNFMADLYDKAGAKDKATKVRNQANEFKKGRGP